MKKIINKIPLKLILMFIIMGIGFITFVKNDAFLYRQPIVRIDKAESLHKNQTTDTFQNEDVEYTQRLLGTISNGKYKDKKVIINNTYSNSQAMDKKYIKGQQAFVIIHKTPSLNVTIKDYKRDVPIVFVLFLAISLMVIFLKMSGVTALGSIVVNSLLFILALLINNHANGAGVVIIFSVLAVIFSFVTLLMVLGFTRQMWITLGSTLTCTFMSVLIGLIVFTITHERGIFYESMQYVTQSPRPLFLAGTLIGSLGAVMDESTDIISSLFTLKHEHPQISKKQIFQSGQNIGKSIMGPLINVLFFIFMGETLPMAILFLKNGNSWGYSFSMNMSLGMVQSLISAIGIVLAVPVSSFLTSIFIKEGGNK
ncbi:YibE/F family protein [Apilactobacillus sp. M161]|uniref:YibE/F family protein n=1 Tax=Apilactobacillus xinyiensis TaxID=2841032 RepID=A0ABT0I1B2_9LACO|nr:YibE/F family protein [Apilactobacillus xinyiensis]MCK8624444.1 YibE/F family protein [Apilactobacillus xinyiensis]